MVSAFEIDPTAVALSDKRELLEERSRRLLSAPGVDHVTASLLSVAEDQSFADLTGTSAASAGCESVLSLRALSSTANRGPETMRTLAPPAGRGYEYVTGTGWDWDASSTTCPILLAEKRPGPFCPARHLDLVIDPTNLGSRSTSRSATPRSLTAPWATRPRSQALRSPPSTSLALLRYGSGPINVTADRTTPPRAGHHRLRR